MKIHHIRNATMLIESQDQTLLIDPMLGDIGASAPPFSVIRFKAKKNPIVGLPEGAENLINQSTHCLITHQHADHLDADAISFLKRIQVPVTCSKLDAKDLSKKGLNIVNEIDYWKTSKFLHGTIKGIPARHGYGFIAKPMGNVMGYLISFPEESSIYLSSDTIYTDKVEQVLKEDRPDISVVACGSAQLDLFQPLLMTIDDILRFIKEAPNYVICNHLEAVNHCPTTRESLKQRLQQEGLLEKVWIPDDGEAKTY